MTFFLPRPEPEPEPAADEVFFIVPWQAPINALPGLGAPGITLVRTDTTALQLALEGAYPQGLALTLRARLHPRHVDRIAWRQPHRGPYEELRIGLEWPDGARVEADHSWDPILHGDRSDDYQLIPGSGGGGDLTYDWSFWLWPLPPAGSVTVNVMWEERGIPETATAVDLGPFVACAAQATELWPLPDQPRDTGGPGDRASGRRADPL